MFREILLDENIELYMDYYQRASYKTIYHHPEFLLAEEQAENYKTYLYIYEADGQFVILPSIKSRINDIEIFMNETEEYFDLVTPHEYSGVIANECSMALVSKFYQELEIFCRDNHIIFSFIRFNPYGIDCDASSGYVVMKSAEQIWIDLKEEDILEKFLKVAKRNVKNAIKNGLVCMEVEKNHENLEIFKKIYNKAMKRLEAKKFFYFSDKYFADLIEAEFIKLYFVYDERQENVLSAAIVLLDAFNKRAYYHLGCRDADNDIRGTMEYLFYHYSNCQKEKGYFCMHLGGGATESLKKFKAKFSDKRISYFIGYKIFNDVAYRRLCQKFCEKYPEMKESSFLPLYRSKE